MSASGQLGGPVYGRRIGSCRFPGRSAPFPCPGYVWTRQCPALLFLPHRMCIPWSFWPTPPKSTANASVIS